MDSLIDGKLENLLIVLKEYFQSQYIIAQAKQIKAPPPSVETKTTTVVHHHHSPYYSWLWPAYGPQQQVTVINNVPATSTSTTVTKKEEDETEKSSNDLLWMVGAGMAIAAVSFAGTYTSAHDPYVTFLLSGIDDQIAGLDEIKSDYIYYHQIMAIKDLLRQWKDAYLSRTQRTFYSKLGTFSGGLFGLGGLFLMSPVGIIGGAVGATAGGCYWAWRNWTTKPLTEKQLFNQLVQKIEALQQDIKAPVSMYPQLYESSPYSSINSIPSYTPSYAPSYAPTAPSYTPSYAPTAPSYSDIVKPY